jgi:hypothetical protein
MIGLLLAAQIAAAQPVPQPPPLFGGPGDHFIIKRITPSPKACAVSGRMEAAFLYRQGDRDPKLLRRWVDYPQGQYCLAGNAP